jgi:ABC-type nitrate/sulfonate/bicarbonate transport system substrate-binding protein
MHTLLALPAAGNVQYLDARLREATPSPPAVLRRPGPFLARHQTVVKAMVKAVMFIRERPEEAADIAMKKIPMGNVSRPLVVEGIRRFSQAFLEGIPGLLSEQGIKTLMEFDVKAPLKIKEDIPPEKV